MEWSDRAGVARGTAWRKGGNLAGSALDAEVPHHRADGVVGGIESPGQFVERLVLNEERAEDFVATMQKVVGFEEKATAGFVLHARISKIGRVTFPKDLGRDGRTDRNRVQGGTRPRGPQAGVLTRRTSVQQGREIGNVRGRTRRGSPKNSPSEDMGFPGLLPSESQPQLPIVRVTFPPR
jgi:hypothetical protein